MVVEQTDPKWDTPQRAVPHVSVALAESWLRLGVPWPVSGDATALHSRRLRTVWCGHGPMDACRCTLVKP